MALTGVVSPADGTAASFFLKWAMAAGDTLQYEKQRLKKLMSSK